MSNVEHTIRKNIGFMGTLDEKLTYLTDIFILTENLREELCNQEGQGEKTEDILRSLRKQVSDDGDWIPEFDEVVGESDEEW